MLAVVMATAGCQLIAGAPCSAEGAGAAIRFGAALIHVARPEAELHTHVDVALEIRTWTLIGSALWADFLPNSHVHVLIDLAADATAKVRRGTRDRVMGSA